jgi:hypothetical protein
MNRILSLLLAFTLLFNTTSGYAQFADQATWAGTGGGTANAQTVTIPNAASLTNLRGVLLKYIPAATNTAATTLTVNALTPTSVLKPSNNSTLAALSGGELRLNQSALLMYDGTQFVLFSTATGGALCGASGLTITNNGVSLVTITYTSATVVDTVGVATYLPGATVTINLAAANGAGALDAGSQTTNTWYYAYLIYNGTANALGSTSSTAPTVPAGYYGTCRIGAFRANGAATLLATKQTGNRTQYLAQAATSLPSIVSGSANVTFWTAESVSNVVPTTATRIQINFYFSASAGANSNNSIGLAPNTNYGTGGSAPQAPVYFAFNPLGQTTNFQNGFNVEFELESTNVYFGSASSASANTYVVSALGWTDAVNAN